MVLLGPFWLLLGRFGPKMAPRMDPQMAPNRPQNHLKEGRCKLKTIKNVKLSLNLGLGFKMVPRWLKMAQVAQDNPKLAQKESQDSPQTGQVWPRWAKIPPKSLQQSPNIAQNRTNMSQDGQDGPTEQFKEPLRALFKPASEVVGLLLCYYLRSSGSLQYFRFANRSSLGLHQTSLRTTCCYRFAWGNLQDT